MIPNLSNKTPTHLYLIAMPIGHRQDITIRGLETLRKSSLIIVEKYRAGKKNLDLLKVCLKDKTITELNENTTPLEKENLMQEMLQHVHISLISDQGTPIFADPGWKLTQIARKNGILVKVLPGANCLLAALCSSGFSLEQFFFLGFLSRSEKDRQNQLKKALSLSTLLVILETPYRLQILLRAVASIFSHSTKIALCLSLTGPDEEIFRGTLAQALKKYLSEKKNNRPFVLIIDNRHFGNKK